MGWALISWLLAAGAGAAALVEHIHTPGKGRPADMKERAAALLMVEADFALLAIAAFLLQAIAAVRAGALPPLDGLAPSLVVLIFLGTPWTDTARPRRAERREIAEAD
jgi:hypothetical protein